METMAKKLSGYILVLNAAVIEGEHWLEVSCANYEEYAKLSAAVSYEGRIYAKKGWSSDSCKASYGPPNNLAIKL
jgi:hypothetical protein